MKAFASYLICLALLSGVPGIDAWAQPVPRVKATVIAFDGKMLTLQPLPPAPPPPEAPPAAKPKKPFGQGQSFAHPAEPEKSVAPAAADPVPDPKPLTVAVLPETKIAATAKAALADIKVGDFAGAVVTADGLLSARELVIYPESLKGSGEGRFAENGRTRINGIVMAVSAGSLTLHYRGSVMTDRTCEGRAAPLAFAGALSCSGDAVIGISADIPVTALKMGDSSLLVPGALVSVSMAKNNLGDPVTPGVVVELPITVEKPQSAP